MKKDYKDFLLILSPALLLVILFFNIQSSQISPKLVKYGAFNYLLIAFVLGLIMILFTDFLIRKKRDFLFSWLIIVVVGISLCLRISFFSYRSGDFKDFLDQWYWFIKNNGGFQALRLSNFSDYNLTYLYFLALLTYLPVNHLIGIKLFSVLFDYLSAFIIYKIIKIKYPDSKIPMYAGLVFLFTPPPILNGAMWGQCDSIYTFFLLVCLYYMLKENYLIGFIFWIISLMFKLQAVFFVIPLILIYIHQKIKLKQALIIPIIFYIIALPALFIGADMIEISVVYFRQTINDGRLNMLAYNIYELFPGAGFNLLFIPGLLFSFGIIILIISYLIVKKVELNKSIIIQLSALSTMVMPFLLPKMHERYFYPAEVMTFIYAFYFPRRWYVPVIIQFLSLNVYHNYFYDTMPVLFWILSTAMGVLILLVAKDFHENVQNAKIKPLSADDIR